MAQKNTFEAAFRQAKVNRGHHIKAETEEQEEKHSHSYSMSCPACKSTIQFAEEDLEQWRTDPTTGSTNDDDENDDADSDGDDDDDDELDSNAKSRLVAEIIAKKHGR
jgi:hypothetical protein